MYKEKGLTSYMNVNSFDVHLYQAKPRQRETLDWKLNMRDAQIEFGEFKH
jgi:hypothetical protein